VFFAAVLVAVEMDVSEDTTTEDDGREARNWRNRSSSQDLQSIKSPSPFLTELSFRCCGQGPSGRPTQRGMIQTPNVIN